MSRPILRTVDCYDTDHDAARDIRRDLEESGYRVTESVRWGVSDASGRIYDRVTLVGWPLDREE